jgi:hypothetical protein
MRLPMPHCARGRTSRTRTALVALFAALSAPTPAPLGAQGTLVPTVGGSGVPVFSYWRFGTAIPQAAGSVSAASQMAVPLRTRFTVGPNWTVDVSTAVVSGQVSLKEAAGSRSLSLSGLSDLTVRATGPLHGDALVLTTGINLPTGRTGLNADETAALATLAAPALSMPVASLGRGFGATLGLLAAREVGEWALAAGLSMEQRTEFTPVSLAMASGAAETSISPGAALHLSLGADRSVGEHRVSVLLVSDGYAADAVTSSQPGSTALTSQYTLGRQTSVLTRIDLARDGWREFALTADLRTRAPFANDAGASVTGSGGSYVDASVTGVKGEIGDRGLVWGFDVRHHSGLTFTDALVGAAVTAAGLTGGVDWSGDRTGLRIIGRLQAGQFDTGTTKTVGVGFTVAGTLSFRGGDR